VCRYGAAVLWAAMMAAGAAEVLPLPLPPQPPPPPLALLQLLGQAPAVSGVRAHSSSASAWLQISADSMHAVRLVAGTWTLVGLCAAQPAPLLPASPGARLSAASATTAPPPAAGSDDAALVDIACRAGAAAAAADAVQQQQQQQQQQQSGAVVLPVMVWPSARLARGTCLLSEGAWLGMARPLAGSWLALWSLVGA
jgi:hypothetical protein